ncbi:hypothetical protein FXO38_34979 [Capsicum annuum]|nr:hypothetical protein FXO38_34979 [Capsicum annuum]
MAAAAISIICNSISFPGSGPVRRIRNGKTCFFRLNRICVVSSHTSQKILKPNRRSRYGQPISPYDSESDEDDAHSFEDEEE